MSDPNIVQAAIDTLPNDWAYTPVAGKKPLTNEWQKHPFSKDSVIQEIKQSRWTGIGALCGVPSGGLLFLDHDGESCDPLIEKLSGQSLADALPHTVTFTSGRVGRYQAVYRIPSEFRDGIATCKIKTGVEDLDGKEEQLEFRWNGCKSVVCGIHPDTKQPYRWIKSPVDTPIADAPVWMIEQMLQDKPTPKPTPTPKPSQAPHLGMDEIPLIKCLAPKHRDLIASGMSEGGRDDAGIALAMDLVGTEQHLRNIGQRFDGDARSLFEDYCSRCNPPLAGNDVDRIWKSAEKSTKGPCLSEDKIQGCIDAYFKREKSQNAKSSKARGKSRAGEAPGNDDRSPFPQSERLWSCLESHNNQLGEWIRVKEEDGEITTFWGPKTNFDLKVSKILEDRTGGGFEFEVTWKERSIVRTRRALVKTHETLTIKDFQTALTRGLGTHVTAKLKPGELADLIQNRKEEYSRNGGVVYRLADRTGQQDDGTWIFEDVQLKADGTPTTEQESRWMFNQSLGELENIPSPAIAPQNPEAIKTLVKALQAFYDPKAMPYALLTIGFAVMGLHRQEIMKHVGEVASLAIYGERGGGKSAVQAAAASLYGLHTWKMSDVSVSMFGEYAKSLGSLPIQWDDPIRQGTYAKADEEKVNTALWKLFTGLGRAVRGNAQAPNTVVCVSTNRTLGAGNAAIASRLISFIFPVHPVTRSAGSALKVAMNGASGGLSQILGISYDVQAIEAHGHQLLEHLSEADSRNANALATLAYFTQKFCELADVDFDALTFIKTDICPQTNEQGAGKDSLTDFLEKLAIFRSEGGAGDWNLTECRSRDGSKYLAVHLSSLWETFEGRFKPNYGQSLIAQLAEDAGGAKKQKRYFVASRDNAIAYHRALNAWEMGIAGSEKPMEPKRDHQASAIIIPRSVAEKAGFFPTSGDHEEPIATPPQPELTLTTAAAPTPEPIEVRQLETTTAVTDPTPPDLGALESDEPTPWNQKDLADARSTIKADPKTVETFKPMIPRSQWKQAGIAESELCAA